MSNAAKFRPFSVRNEEANETVRFTIPKRYTNIRFIRAGAQGAVVSATDTIKNTKVAIKKMQQPFLRSKKALRAFREIVFLSSLDHPNIIKFLSVFTPQESPEEFQDIYLVMEFMDSTVEEVVGKCRLDHERLSKFIYQTLCAVSHLHRRGIIHRDLKPCNLVVNDNDKYELKVLDFGFARVISTDPAQQMSAYVVTRHYRAPEVVLKLNYCEKVDVWSIGCILAEMITGKILFPGRSNTHQWDKIVEIMGTPHEFLDGLPSGDQIRKRTPVASPTSLEELIPDDSIAFKEDPHRHWTAQNARNLIAQMLVIDPNERCSVAQALNDPYVSFWARNNEMNARLEQALGGEAEFGYDSNLDDLELSVDELKVIIFDEVKRIESMQDIFGGL